VQLRPGSAATADALIEHTRTQIASYKKPRSIGFVESLPRLFNGKSTRRRCGRRISRGGNGKFLGIFRLWSRRRERN
jgi:acyl-coenzyme A synthetase/AMP-(fatty) acid ligase